MVAIVPYIKDILHGTTRPNIVSWALWVLLLLISLLAQVNAGASWSALMVFGDLIGTSTILVLCLVGYGYGKYGWVEFVCTILAIVAIIAWRLEHQPVLAICFAALADLMAATPTLVKSYRDPWSEAPGQYFLIAFAAGLAMLSTTIFDVVNLIFPAYLLLINGSIGTLAFFGRKLKTHP
jgi:hypothetical protein